MLQFQPRARIELNLFVSYLEKQGGCAGNIRRNVGENVAGINLVALTDLYILQFAIDGEIFSVTHNDEGKVAGANN